MNGVMANLQTGDCSKQFQKAWHCTFGNGILVSMYCCSIFTTLEEGKYLWEILTEVFTKYAGPLVSLLEEVTALSEAAICFGVALVLSPRYPH